MLIQTAISSDVYSQLQNGQTVKAATDFDGGPSTLAYQLLSDCAQLEDFFFGIVVTNIRLQEDLDYLTSLSNANNVVTLQLEIPDNLLFVHDYYTFTDLIYDAEGYDGINIPLETLQESAQHLTNLKPNRVLQVIYPYIDPNWIKSVRHL